MPKLPSLTPDEIIKILEGKGFVIEGACLLEQNAHVENDASERVFYAAP